MPSDFSNRCNKINDFVMLRSALLKKKVRGKKGIISNVEDKDQHRLALQFPEDLFSVQTKNRE